jgi:hypothetical protein
MTKNIRYGILVYNPKTRYLEHDYVEASTRDQAIDIALSRCLKNGLGQESILEGRHYRVDLYPTDWDKFMQDVNKWGD